MPRKLCVFHRKFPVPVQALQKIRNGGRVSTSSTSAVSIDGPCAISSLVNVTSIRFAGESTCETIAVEMRTHFPPSQLPVSTTGWEIVHCSSNRKSSTCPKLTHHGATGQPSLLFDVNPCWFVRRRLAHGRVEPSRKRLRSGLAMDAWLTKSANATRSRTMDHRRRIL
jgi:hypothetical protein